MSDHSTRRTRPRPKRRPACKSGKRSFPTEPLAYYVGKAWGHRVYKCERPECGSWHLTSQKPPALDLDGKEEGAR